MKVFSVAAAAATLFATTVVADVDPIVIKGTKFFYKTNGTQFFIKGVAYQQDLSSNGTVSGATTYKDPLADATACARDVPYLKQLQTNTIRVYAIDPTADHSSCMKLLQDNGIYVVADLSEPSTSINRDDPSWTDDLYTRYTSVVDAMANYTNVLGFFAGNEVSNKFNNTAASAFVKAAVRDTKSYISQKNYRAIGVGYATNDDADIRENMANYFNCGDKSSSIDFWGYNVYSWCGDSSYETSGYNTRTEQFANYSVPVFFAEYGCNTAPPRLFTETVALFGDDMSPVWSGGIVYMYFEETNNYGLVTVGSDSKVTTLSDFSRYSTEIAKVTPSSINSASYNPTNTALAACPSVYSEWQAVASPLPPAANPQLCSCMLNSVSCTVTDKTSEDDYGTLFSQVCGYSNGTYCAGIQHNATTGTYGAYGMCNPKEQLAFAFNQYYQAQSNKASACAFGGSASTKAATSASGTCASLMSQAGTAGTGTVTAKATGGATSTAKSSSKSSAGAVSIPHFNFGMLQLGAYIFGAALTGAGMILL